MKFLIYYALSFLGTPYRWGGDDPSGFDCSGLVIELLTAGGVYLPYDMTAHDLYNYLIIEEKGLSTTPKEGALVFFGSAKKITHVGFCLNEFQMIEAGGGDSRTRTIEDAWRKNAFVRLREVHSREDIVGFILPKYPFKRQLTF